MSELYPQLGQKFDRQLKSDLHKIGFTGWVHLNKEKRDGKVRLTWTHPMEGHQEWFLILLVLEDGQLFIDFLKNPLGQNFDRGNVKGVITYINSVIRKQAACG
jgi:hypothetical protein